MEVKISFNRPTSRKQSGVVKRTSVKIVEGNPIEKKSGMSKGNTMIELKNEKKSINLKLKDNNGNSESLPDITDKLVLMGYTLESINLAYNRYKFKSIDHALFIMGLDPETGYYHHQFYPKGKKTEDEEDSDEEENPDATMGWNKNVNKYNLCVICKDIKEKHFDLYSDGGVAPLNTMNNVSVFQETHNNLIAAEEYKEFKQDTDVIQKKMNQRARIDPSFIEKLEIEFKDKNLCIICYSEELDEHSYKLPCGHMFCRPCIKHYLENLIGDSKVDNIKCLQAGCKHLIPEPNIKENISQELWMKYVRFKRRSAFLENLKKGYVPCTAPDCEEWVSYRDGNDPFVECGQGHQFCAKCKEGWHKRGDCRNRNVERVLKSNTKIRTCPHCGNFIEKVDGCNHMTCALCSYEFCWLCMRKYEYYHYYVFNVKGCPGMRYANPKSKNSLWSNPFFKCLWCILTVLLGILAIAAIIALWFLLGATYEFIKCYQDDKSKNQDEEDDDASVSRYDFENPSNNNTVQNNSNVSANTQPKEKPPKTKTQICLIYSGIVFLGLLVQPFYLLFKFIEMLMECYRRYGCWFYYFGSY